MHHIVKLSIIKIDSFVSINCSSHSSAWWMESSSKGAKSFRIFLSTILGCYFFIIIIKTKEKLSWIPSTSLVARKVRVILLIITFLTSDENNFHYKSLTQQWNKSKKRLCWTIDYCKQQWKFRSSSSDGYSCMPRISKKSYSQIKIPPTNYLSFFK